MKNRHQQDLDIVQLHQLLWNASLDKNEIVQGVYEDLKSKYYPQYTN